MLFDEDVDKDDDEDDDVDDDEVGCRVFLLHRNTRQP